MPPLGWSFLWLVIVACLALACASIAHWGGFAYVVAVLVPAAPLWCDLLLREDRRAGLGVDGGRCRGGVTVPTAGLEILLLGAGMLGRIKNGLILSQIMVNVLCA